MKQLKIEYEFNGGYWAPKDEVKESFYTDLYNFVNQNYQTELKTVSLVDFINFEPYIIGNLAGKYFLKEEIGGKLEDQPDNYFIGFCYKNNKYLDLIPHLIKFFALWRVIEGCMEKHADDFFASSWASLVDTAKFFKYTTVEELQKSPESPTVRDERILYMLKNCPGLYHAPIEVDNDKLQRLPKPRKDGYEFVGWYDNPNFIGEIIQYVSKDLDENIKYYARWRTHTYFHSNDGYPTFEDLYNDFLADFSRTIGREVGKTTERILPHGMVSEFCKVSFNGGLNNFFAVKENHQKWWWLIEYIKSLKKVNFNLSLFDFKNGKFKSEAQVRWELNSLFIGRFHITWPHTSDYSGAGVKETIADSTNSSIIKINYLVGEDVEFPKMNKEGYNFVGWYNNPKGENQPITKINDDRYATKILYAKWSK